MIETPKRSAMMLWEVLTLVMTARVPSLQCIFAEVDSASTPVWISAHSRTIQSTSSCEQPMAGRESKIGGDRAMRYAR